MRIREREAHGNIGQTLVASLKLLQTTFHGVTA